MLKLLACIYFLLEKISLIIYFFQSDIIKYLYKTFIIYCDCGLKHAHNYDYIHQRDPFYTSTIFMKHFANFLKANLLSKN